MSYIKVQALIILLVLLYQISAADVLVQLNVNRPLNDVNENFVSFAVKPEELFMALDGPNRKSLTRMANMLGDSYVKFVGDYFFTANSEKKLRNPAKAIWKGFNRWSRAVNWTMIIPVPYAPKTWDPMVALKILNNSYAVGVTDCIWQLGTDFGSTRAQDYVTELNTLNLMVDSFRPYVDDWQVIGADISAGSSPEETRRYIDMSKNLNTAFGWTYPAELITSNSLSNYVYTTDPSLKVLLSRKVPVWLTLPAQTRIKRSKSSTNENINEAMNWAQALGDAASSGFDAIFRHISLSELETPTHSFYVTALFKKVMGSRVFPAKPLGLFTHSSKLYTHCANAVSGGIAFMIVNMDDTPAQISLRSLTQLNAKEVWQYTLTFKDGVAYLNNEKLSIDSALKPQKKAKNVLKPVQLDAPAKSVSFWVLPTVNIEHCQYTEIEAQEVEKLSTAVESVPDQKLSSSDVLLKKLIQETALSHSALTRGINRRRRYATFAARRPKRFLLQEGREEMFKPRMGNLFEAFTFDDRTLKKRESDLKQRQQHTFDWLRNLLENPFESGAPLLKRGRRSADNYFGSFFGPKHEKQMSFTKKIFDIKKPEKKVKPLFNLDEFDEEEFFKKVSEDIEPEYRRLPEGDVHLRHITTLDGEEVDENKELPKTSSRKVKSVSSASKESTSEMRPLRLLPTEFYESLPVNAFKPTSHRLNIGSALNSLLFPEPFTKKTSKQTAREKIDKKSDSELELLEESETTAGRPPKRGQLVNDFLRTQKELGMSFLTEQEQNLNKERDQLEDYEVEVRHDSTEDKLRESEKRKLIDFLAENLEVYFDELNKQREDKSANANAAKEKQDDKPWWQLSTSGLRKKRALQIQVPEAAWRDNMITKDDELTPLGATMPEQLAVYEYGVYRENDVKNNSNMQESKEIVPNTLVATVKQKVSNLMDIVARHVSEWYNTLAKHMEIETVTVDNNQK